MIVHEIFGREALERSGLGRDLSTDEVDAFLLGNQGPDPLFFANPIAFASAWGVGSKMHRAKPEVVLSAFKDAASALPEDLRGIGRAYAMGMACHYLLDSEAHPLINSQTAEICSAGVEGLGPDANHEVHAQIESDLDSLILYRRLGKTIADVSPATGLLGNDRTLAIISLVWKKAAEVALESRISQDAYAAALRNYRLAANAFHSPSGIKRGVLGMLERAFRSHSMIQAMSPVNARLDSSPFENAEGREWKRQGTGELSHESFESLYAHALERALKVIDDFDSADMEYFDKLACGLDFNGEPTKAMIVEVESAN